MRISRTTRIVSAGALALLATFGVAGSLHTQTKTAAVGDTTWSVASDTTWSVTGDTTWLAPADPIASDPTSNDTTWSAPAGHAPTSDDTTW